VDLVFTTILLGFGQGILECVTAISDAGLSEIWTVQIRPQAGQKDFAIIEIDVRRPLGRLWHPSPTRYRLRSCRIYKSLWINQTAGHTLYLNGSR
jgi:hypothetical protein